MKISAFLFVLLCSSLLCAQFVSVDVSFDTMYETYSSWGDFDEDEVYDLMIGGFRGNTFPAVENYLFQSNGDGTFLDLGFACPPIRYGESAWVDVNNDGNLDMIIMGLTGAMTQPVLVYHGSGAGDFNLAYSSGLGLINGSLDTGDFDGDGDVDILITGNNNNTGYTRILRNDGTEGFTSVAHPLPNVRYGDAKWIDYDNDGDLDVCISGEQNFAPWRISRLYENTGTSYVDTGIALPQLNYSVWEWADCNADGFMDFLLLGNDGANTVSALFYGNGVGGFVAQLTNLPNLQAGKAQWGDLNQDGYPDVIMSGWDGSGFNFGAYRYVSPGLYARITGSYLNIPLSSETLCLVDFDNDYVLDMFYSGWYNGYGDSVTKLFRNTYGVPNTIPTPPSVLTHSASDGIVLSWDGADDNETHGNALSYRVRMGTAPSACDVVSQGSDEFSGYSYIPAPGKYYGKMKLADIESGTYHYAVQSIDGAFAASVWSEEENFTCIAPESPWVGSMPFSITSSPASAFMLVTDMELSDPLIPAFPVGLDSEDYWVLKLSADSGMADLTLNLGVGVWRAFVYQNGAWEQAVGSPFEVTSGIEALALPQIDFAAKGDVYILVGTEGITLPVELGYFMAVSHNSGNVTLSWMWHSGTPVTGYRIYRNETENLNSAIQLTPQMIPAINSPEDDYYSYNDNEVNVPGAYYYWLEAQFNDHASFYGPAYIKLESPTQEEMPQVFALGDAYPNPFVQQTTLPIQVKEGSTGLLTIYNLKGQVVTVIPLEAGNHKVSWEGRDTQGNLCAPGVYFYRLSGEGLNLTRKMLLLGQ